METQLPIWIGKKRLKIAVRKIPGNCELLIGSKLLELFETYFDIQKKLVKFGQYSKWQPILLNAGRHMCIPLVPRTITPKAEKGASVDEITPTLPYTSANTHYTKDDIKKYVEAPITVKIGQACSNEDKGLFNRLNSLEEINLICQKQIE